MSIEKRLLAAGGRRSSAEEMRSLAARFPIAPAIARVFEEWPLAEASLSLSEEDDLSGLGAEIRLMTPEHIASEAGEAYPGVVAIKRGYTPIGDCLEGSGDPYFYRHVDGAVVRIPHDAVVGDDGLDESRVELVARSIEDLVLRATPASE
jgi:hypothetical protein